MALYRSAVLALVVTSLTCSFSLAEDAKAPADEEKQLLKERLALATDIHAMHAALYKIGKVSVTEVIASEKRVAHARLELATTSEERQAILRDLVKLAESSVQTTEALVDAAQADRASLFLAKYELADAKLRLVREQKSQATKPK